MLIKENICFFVYRIKDEYFLNQKKIILSRFMGLVYLILYVLQYRCCKTIT